MNVFELEKKILKAKTPEEIDNTTKDVDAQMLRDVIKLIVDRLTPYNIKANKF